VTRDGITRGVIMIMRILAGSIVVLGLGLVSESVNAGQTFVCDDGRLLQVEQKDVERLKQQDTCIAAYFGLKVRPVPLPVQRPPETAAGLLKGAQKAAAPRRAIGNVAQVSTDYRNVRIINASGRSRRWFRHRR
jgi:hypothetical protein